MITWDNFLWFAIVAVVLWTLGAGFSLASTDRSRPAIVLSMLGHWYLLSLSEVSG